MAFIISETNPNQDSNGTGCIYSGDQKDFDCKGRHVVFPIGRLFSPVSPHVVLCEYHARVVVGKLDDAKTEVARLAVGRNLTPLPNDTQTLPKPKPKLRPKPAPPTELSL